MNNKMRMKNIIIIKDERYTELERIEEYFFDFVADHYITIKRDVKNPDKIIAFYENSIVKDFDGLTNAVLFIATASASEKCKIETISYDE